MLIETLLDHKLFSYQELERTTDTVRLGADVHFACHTMATGESMSHDAWCQTSVLHS